jgi:hypothetical protein
VRGWEGETLVVDVTNFTDQTWFDRSGNYHSDALHVVNGTRAPGRITFSTKPPSKIRRPSRVPWKISMPLYRRVERNAQLLEYECQAYLEAERDKQR